MRLQPLPTLPSGRPGSRGATRSPDRASSSRLRFFTGFFLSIISAVGFLCTTTPANQSPNQVKANGYVMDMAGVLSQSAKDQLTALCTEVDQKTQAQIAVVTIKSLDGRPIEDYSVDLATRLGIGPKSSSRGVLILVATEDHKYWTSVGYGLEPILTDGKVGGFGREAVPYLRNNDYDAALLLLTRRVADVIAADKGVTLTGSVPASPESDDGNRGHGSLGQIIGLLFAIFIIYSIFRGIGGGMGRYGRGGGWWIGPMIGAGMSRGGWGGGGFGGGGGGGGGFGGFGGGSFGGGGAGGSW
jgi:uncharacterized protein